VIKLLFKTLFHFYDSPILVQLSLDLKDKHRSPFTKKSGTGEILLNLHSMGYTPLMGSYRLLMGLQSLGPDSMDFKKIEKP